MLEEKLKRIRGKLLLYGAHLVAMECARWLIGNGKGAQIAGVAVTDIAGNPVELVGFAVKRIDEYVENSRHLTVIIAVPEKYHDEVEQYARARGFCRFLKVSLEDMSKLKVSQLLILQNKYAQLSFYLEEDRNDMSWLNMWEQRSADKSNGGESAAGFHVKFPSLFYLDEEKVFAEAATIDLQKNYETICGQYQSIHMLPAGNTGKRDVNKPEAVLNIYMAFSKWDSTKVKTLRYAPWIRPIQVGSKISEQRDGSIFDDTGSNISEKNSVFAEMTGAFWIWKNGADSRYKGLCHYRRHFIITEQEIMALEHNGIDVILTTPRYVPGGIKNMFLAETPVKYPVYERMLHAISQLVPEDRAGFEVYMKCCFYYPNNMVIARNDIYDMYCTWIFPILFRIMEIDIETGYKYMQDRHIAYAAELLTSYYFVKNKDIYNIAVTDYRFYE